MIVLPKYTLPPFVCYHCRTDRLPTVYTQREDEDARGPNSEHIFFCYECLLHAAREVAPLVGQQVIATVRLDEERADALAVVAERDEARRQRDLAVTARDAIVASLAANPLPLHEAVTAGAPVSLGEEPATEGSGKRWRK